MTYPRIDAHVHIWDQSRNEEFIATKVFPVLKGKNFLPQAMEQMLDETGASQAVLVHGPATDTHTDFCLELADLHERVLSVIGWVDLRADDVMDRLNELSLNPNFVGIRLTPMLDEDPQNYLCGPKTMQVLKVLAQKGLIAEVLAPVEFLPAVVNICQAIPTLCVVIAHFGLPDLNSDNPDLWCQAMTVLADYPEVRVKISGLALRGGSNVDRGIATQYVTRLLDLFGSDRLHYASNWPVMTAHTTPELWERDLQLILQLLNVSSRDTAAIFTNNTKALYAPRSLSKREDNEVSN